jgi:glycerol-3-phosphate acyltransferase PlsY
MRIGPGYTIPYFAGALMFGYLLGSIPFGILLTRLFGGPDLRAVGSGNIGATNVLRTGHRGLAAATLLGDILKGTVAVVAMSYFSREMAICAALGAFLGHLFPIWLRFRGGKGVATFIGLLLGFKCWFAVLGFCVIWALVAAITRYSSLAALTASAVTPIILWWTSELAPFFLLLVVMLWIMHRANIARLIRGTESKIGT